VLICLTASHKNAAFDLLERLSANAEHAAPRILEGHDAVQGFGLGAVGLELHHLHIA